MKELIIEYPSRLCELSEICAIEDRVGLLMSSRKYTDEFSVEISHCGNSASFYLVDINGVYRIIFFIRIPRNGKSIFRALCSISSYNWRIPCANVIAPGGYIIPRTFARRDGSPDINS